MGGDCYSKIGVPCNMFGFTDKGFSIREISQILKVLENISLF